MKCNYCLSKQFKAGYCEKHFLELKEKIQNSCDKEFRFRYEIGIRLREIEEKRKMCKRSKADKRLFWKFVNPIYNELDTIIFLKKL